MIRCLLLVLVFVLPAQHAWAALLGYCGHESSPVSFHIGHHTHEHRALPLDEDHAEVVTGVPTPVEAHCSAYHAAMAHFASIQSPVPGPSTRTVFISSPTSLFDTLAAASIERPKWARAD